MIGYNNKTDLTNVYLGDVEISEVYIGNNKVYPSEPTPPHDYSNDYFTVRVRGGDFYFIHNNSFPISYSSDGGNTWWNLYNGVYMHVQTPCEVLFKANATSEVKLDLAPDYGVNGSMEVYGNILSMVYGDNFRGKTTLEDPLFTFGQFFKGNKKIINAENLILPLTTLTNRCYNSMFSGCTSLATAPELPATTLASYCYSSMFNNCTSLTTAPELPATTLVGGCYEYMFANCTSLNYIKCLATDISANYCTFLWVPGVASSGTFVKAASMNDWTSGSDGIPNGWNVVNDHTWVSYQSGDTFTGNENISGIRISLEEATRLMDIDDYYGEVNGNDGTVLETSSFSFGVVQSEGRIVCVDDGHAEDIPLVDGYFTLTLDNTKEWRIGGTMVFEETYNSPPYLVPFNCDLLM